MRCDRREMFRKLAAAPLALLLGKTQEGAGEVGALRFSSDARYDVIARAATLKKGKRAFYDQGFYLSHTGPNRNGNIYTQHVLEQVYDPDQIEIDPNIELIPPCPPFPWPAGPLTFSVSTSDF